MPDDLERTLYAIAVGGHLHGRELEITERDRRLGIIESVERTGPPLTARLIEEDTVPDERMTYTLRRYRTQELVDLDGERVLLLVALPTTIDGVIEEPRPPATLRSLIGPRR